VMHVHFHIIPKLGETGLGIGWRPTSLPTADAEALLASLHAALEQDARG